MFWLLGNYSFYLYVHLYLVNQFLQSNCFQDKFSRKFNPKCKELSSQRDINANPLSLFLVPSVYNPARAGPIYLLG